MVSLCQVALSTFDLDRSVAWYCDVFGFLPSGRRSIGGEQLAGIIGLPEVDVEIAWLVDSQEFFQLELFRFARPTPKDGLRAAHDIGYTRFGIHVDDFDEALSRLAAAGTLPLTDPVGSAGLRRVAVHDPDGVLIELMEGSPPTQSRQTRPSVPASVRYITASVRDIERAQRFWVDAVGLAPSGVTLHGPEHEQLWGLEGADRKALTLWANGVAIELVEYAQPRGADRPAAYRICDRGILNVAVGGPDQDSFETVVARTRAAGYRHNPEGVFPGARAVYLEDDQGFSLELLYSSRYRSAQAGFEPA